MRPMGVHTSASPRHRDGLSLLEILLALAILALGMAAITDVTRSALRNARMARELTQAELLAETKMAELLSGVVEMEPISEATFDDIIDTAVVGEQNQSSAPTDRWLYSVDITTLDETGLNEIRVTVWRNVPEELRPTTVTLVRWALDEEAIALAMEAAAAAEESSEEEALP